MSTTLQQIPTSSFSDNDLVDEATACRLIGGSSTPIHRSTLWRGVNAGRYPRPLKISASTNRWRVVELRKTLEQFAAERGTVA